MMGIFAWLALLYFFANMISILHLIHEINEDDVGGYYLFEFEFKMKHLLYTIFFFPAVLTFLGFVTVLNLGDWIFFKIKKSKPMQEFLNRPVFKKKDED